MYLVKLAAPAAIVLSLAAPALAQEATSGQTTYPVTSGPDSMPLGESVRSTSQEALQDTLYDLIALKETTHQYHWNIVGTDFYQLHEFYAELYEAAGGFIDPTAERLRAIGYPADGNLMAAAQNSEVPAAPVDEVSRDPSNEALLEMWSGFSDRLYERIDSTSEDMPTQDFLIGIAYAVDKYTWQIRAHLTEGNAEATPPASGATPTDAAPAEGASQ